MTKAPVAEQLFLLDHVAGLGGLDVDRELVGAVVNAAADFAAREWAPLSRSGDIEGARLTGNGVQMPEGFREAYRAYVDAGWGTIGLPESIGGQQLPFSVQLAVSESLGTANLAFTLCPMLTLGAVEAITAHGSDEQKRLYLPRLATGHWTGTMNLTEPQAGSDVGAVRTRAEPRSDGRWSITGTKIFITYGDHDLAENIVHLVLAKTPDAPEGTRGISLFLVPKHRLDEHGERGKFNDVRVVSVEHKLGLHASPTCMLSFGDDGECIGELVGDLHGGMRAMFTMMNNARLNVGLQGVQLAEAATQRAVAYALERVQSARAGSPDRKPVRIAEHPDVRRMLMRMKALTQAARSLVYCAAGLVDLAARGDEDAALRLQLLTPLAKAYPTDIACEVSSIGMQVHGGTGYIEETGAAQHYRDARILPIYEGTNGIQAADLVQRKLSLQGGSVFTGLLDEMDMDTTSGNLRTLIGACRETASRLQAANIDDRLAGSSPFLTMVSVAVCGWLLEQQSSIVAQDSFGRAKSAVARFYLEQLIPEALGLAAAANAGAEVLYLLESDELAV